MSATLSLIWRNNFLNSIPSPCNNNKLIKTTLSTTRDSSTNVWQCTVLFRMHVCILVTWLVNCTWIKTKWWTTKNIERVSWSRNSYIIKKIIPGDLWCHCNEQNALIIQMFMSQDIIIKQHLLYKAVILYLWSPELY